MNNDLAQWLRDFADANDGDFDPSTVENLLKAVDMLIGQKAEIMSLQRSYCNISSDFSYEVHAEDISPMEYATRSGWNCFDKPCEFTDDLLE